MSKEMGVVLLGLLVVITPYLGFPSGWREVLLLLAGLGVMLLGFLLRGEQLSRSVRPAERLPFVESSKSGAQTEHDA